MQYAYRIVAQVNISSINGGRLFGALCVVAQVEVCCVDSGRVRALICILSEREMLIYGQTYRLVAEIGVGSINYGSWRCALELECI